jgi:hypothetical protein
MKTLLPYLCLLLLGISCKSAQHTPKTYNDAQIRVGSSGGVSGMIREYCLLDNGQLFISKGVEGEWKEMKKLKKGLTREIFNKADKIEIQSVKFKHPGNMTYYIIFRYPPRTNEIKWGESGVTPPEGIKPFYDYLMTIFKP